ncbi:acylphosphatase [bacterium]|nr:acylphosphatase [bacterium]
MRQRAQVFFSGRVQGVGFRYSMRELACGYEVAGYVRNLPDGRVELCVEGDSQEVEAFLDGIRVSHLAGYLRNTDRRWLPATGEFRGFEIRF